MGFLQWPDVVFNYDMQGPFTVFNFFNRRIHAQGSKISGLGTLYMDAGDDTQTNFPDTDRGYRDSYGRYYSTGGGFTDKMWVSNTTLQRSAWEKASFTYGFVFRNTSTSGGQRWLMSKPSTNSIAVPTVGNEIELDDRSDPGMLEWRTSQDVGATEIVRLGPGFPAGFEGILKNTWYICYIIKADGVASRIGIKKKGDSSWTANTSGESQITVDYDNSKDAALLGKINRTTGAKQDPFFGDLQRFCMWDVAVGEIPLQLGLEDHFGRADTIVAVQRSSILS